ncbi:NAD(P)/FAD-dependent oxidoreductase [Anderseniella sp. Alg231-50]|uniref:NAD(P)/FAD-dependent oxidoreductase n=1 Tax=Anderseniella sp. Alg231-50 TaxID=1922226 RepID=UPI00307BA180
MATHTTSIPATPDVVIIGAGVVGLWCALKAKQQGLSAVVVDKGRIGQGASGGVLGALMPHRPVSWEDVQTFQLEALLSLETEIADLEAVTGISCGYSRCGRIMPVDSDAFLAEHEQWQAGSTRFWPAVSRTGKPISWEIMRGAPDPAWPTLKPAFVAYSFDTLSARINPRRLLSALASSVQPEVVVVENCLAVTISNDGEVLLADGTRLSPGRVIVAAGHESFDLLQPVLHCSLGWGVKGQAVLLRPKDRSFANMPIIYSSGIYVIAHDDGLVAVGSTSQRAFTDGDVDEAVSQKLVQRAVELCPGLDGAAIVEQWAGIRPRAAGRDPLIGPLPDASRVILASGGFKITLGIAHRMADAALAFAMDAPCELPDSFTVQQHIANCRSSDRY